MSDSPSSAEVVLRVRNDLAADLNLVLEPWGEIHPLRPGETRTVTYRGDPAPRLSLDVGTTEIKIWAEGPGTFELGDLAS